MKNVPLWKKIGLGIIIFLAVIIFGRNILIKTVASTFVKAATGSELQIGKFYVGLFNTKIHIKDVKILNPKDFEDRVMLDLPEVLVDYRLGELIKGNIYLDHLTFNLEQFMVVKKADGVSNLDKFTALGGSSDKKDASKEVPKKEEKKTKKKVSFHIDQFDLRIKQVVMKDYSKNPDKPSIKNFDLNLDSSYKDVDNPTALGALIMNQVLLNTTIGKVVNVDMSGITNALGDVGGKAKETIGKAGAAVGDAAGKAADGLKSVTGGLMKALPFGGDK